MEVIAVNVESLEKLSRIVWPALTESIYMVGITVLSSIIIGAILATLLCLTDAKGLHPNLLVNRFLNIAVNVVRSFPFVILIVALMPLTRKLTGTVIGSTAALVPLIISSSSLVARMIEASFRNVPYETIEAIKSFGASNWQIMTRVVLKEAVPSMVSGLTVAVIAILGSSAAAGAVGAGGLGAVAINYGYSSFDDTIMYGTVLILILLVQGIQAVGNQLFKQSLR